MDKSTQIWYTASDCKAFYNTPTHGGTEAMNHRLIQYLSILMACVLLLSGACPALAETLKSAPLTEGNSRNGMVRVRLASLGSPATLNLTVYGSYTVNGNTSKTLGDKTAATVKFNATSGTLSLTVGSVTTEMGSSFKLRRHQTDGTNGIKIAQGRVPGNLYPGDFQFLVRGSAGSYSLYVIAYVYMEDYLYGVVPYEMSNSCGLEALKAQAVAARTYTLRAMSASTASVYDVVDTTSDQVYSGTPSGNANCKAAVDATKGIALKNGTNFTATYYTASNGGQTESVQNAWGGSGYSYLVVKDDPYDLANPDSRKVSFTVKKSGEQSSAKLASLFSQKAAAQFGAGAAVTQVNAVYAHTPKYAEPSRLYTKLSFDVVYTRGGQSGSGTMTFDIFKELESPLQMSIASGNNELWSVLETDTGFQVTARRYGHGIGMSQRGAMYMDKLGYTYDQILAFYFEGCARVQYTLTRSILSPVVSGQDSQEQVISEPPADLPETPVPTAAPGGEEGLWARVTPVHGSLNLRKTASDSAKVLLTIPKGELIPILEKGAAWCKTEYAGTAGYVMTKFLTFAGEDAQPQPTPSPAPAPTAPPAAVPDPSEQETLYARVTTVSGSLNLRAAAASNAKVLRTIPQYAVIPILSRGDVWCRTSYEGVTGYVMTSFLTFLSGASAPVASPTAAPTAAPQPASPAPASGVQYARVTTVSGSLNLRVSPRDTARVLRTIPQNDLVIVLVPSGTWCQVTYNGMTGYVMSKFLTFLGELPLQSAAPASAAPAPTPTHAPTAVPAPAGSAGMARVTTASGSLNLRAAARDTARVLTTIPQNAVVTVLIYGAAWTQVRYNGQTGYVMTKFLTLLDGQPAQPVQPSPVPAATPAPAPAGAEALTPLQTPVQGRVMSTSRSLNLREAASTDARVITEIPKYDFVLITAVGDTWCAVEYEGMSGYCMRRYLEFSLYGP